MSDFEKVNITMKASVTFRGTGDDLKVKMKELKVRTAKGNLFFIGRLSTTCLGLERKSPSLCFEPTH